MGFFGVSDKKEKDLRLRMKRLNVSEEDIVEKFIKSGGPGGQKINKTSNCVYLKHIPSGKEVKCSRERSQALNRFLARRMLVDKIEESILGRVFEQRKKIEKIKRQKRKRSKRAKEKMLDDKNIQSKKKALRNYAKRMTDE